jgi:uncharacterized cupredoxin-like copper-binding protein
MENTRKNMKTSSKIQCAAALAAGITLASPAWSHGDAHEEKHTEAVAREQKPWGIAGDAKGARTVVIRMTDDMRFQPGSIEVREGETIRFVVRNAGKVLHEMVIGTPQELQAHAAMMKKFPTMEHDEPFMTHVKSGRQGEIVWNFNRPGTFQFACLIPGHFEAGMMGMIVVTPATPQGKKP